MNEEEIYYAIALTCLPHLSQGIALQLCRELGTAKAVYDHRHDIGSLFPYGCPPRLAVTLSNWNEALQHAEAEMQFIRKYDIHVLTLTDNAYPARLRECPDAPLVLYFKGMSDLNARYVINIVGTRHSTAYGQDLIRRFVSQLKERCPQVVIVSGLAYGIDICAHRQALDCGLETIGVLAHGLEKIYPTQHRDTAMQMTRQGGLLTEYMSFAHMDKSNFVRRNRIVAGMTDATILVESAAKGGGLITAEMAQGYGRSVFAFPGAVGVKTSEGCNNLIRDNGAGLITSADDFLLAMGWVSDDQLRQARSGGVERSLFPELTAEEQTVVQVLDKDGDLQQNILSVKTNISIGQLTAILFQLEMKGVVRPMAGGNFHLVK